MRGVADGMPSVARRLSTIASVTKCGAGLQIEFSCGGGGFYPFLWLRDASPAPAHRLQSGQRLFETHELPESAELACELKTTSADAIELQWDDSVAARYPASFLREFAPGGAASSQRERYAGRTLWPTPAALSLEPHDWPAVESGEALLPFLRDLRRYGVARLASLPPERGAVLRAAAAIGHVRTTNYGSVFDVKTVTSGLANLAQSGRALSLHTDNPYREPCPGIQLLHCLVADPAGGGATLVADGWAIGEALRTADPPAFAALSAPRRFRYADVGSNGDAPADLVAERPPFSLDPHSGAITAVAYNNRSALPPPVGRDASGGEAEAAYAAWRALGRLCADVDGRAAKVRLAPGDALVMDNSRVMHGRALLGRRASSARVPSTPTACGRACRARGEGGWIA